MRIVNFGSVNIDLVYQVDHFVQAGETLSSTGYARHMGGKGFNQSIALARAGADVYHAGCIGEDGEFLRAYLEENGVRTDYLKTVSGPSGHALIQVDKTGENCILLFGGANQQIEKQQIVDVLAQFEAGDILLLQNEISGLETLLCEGAKRGMRIAFNPAPMSRDVLEMDLRCVRWLIVNEGEGEMLSGEKGEEAILSALKKRLPDTAILLTLGKRGSCYQDKDDVIYQAACSVGDTVDTTGAGDTFTGYFLSQMAQNVSAGEALQIAACAAGIAVTRPGAAQSIPAMQEVKEA